MLPDGTPIVAAAGYYDVQVWDLRDGTELGALDLRGGPITGVALPDRT
jgi:hypothetical protein